MTREQIKEFIDNLPNSKFRANDEGERPQLVEEFYVYLFEQLSPLIYQIKKIQQDYNKELI